MCVCQLLLLLFALCVCVCVCECVCARARVFNSFLLQEIRRPQFLALLVTFFLNACVFKTHERLRRTLFVGTKHSMLSFILIRGILLWTWGFLFCFLFFCSLFVDFQSEYICI